MFKLAVVRRIDEYGRVVIPRELRKAMHLKEGDPMEFYMDNGTLILKKYQEEEEE